MKQYLANNHLTIHLERGLFMKQIIYLKASQHAQLEQPKVLFKNFLTVYTCDENMKNYILSLPFHTFEEEGKQQLVVSILKIIEIITSKFPDAEIRNIGEEDIILTYSPVSKNEKVKECIFTIFICLVAFFGGGYAIMAYNTDAGAKELFTYLSMLFLGNATEGVTCLVITYSIGLTLGMILFFNHFGNKKLSADPTPLEIQMRLYENDLSTTIISDAGRKGESVEVTQ